MNLLPRAADRRLMALVVLAFYSIYFGIFYSTKTSPADWAMLILVLAAGVAVIIQSTVVIHRQKRRKQVW